MGQSAETKYLRNACRKQDINSVQFTGNISQESRKNWVERLSCAHDRTIAHKNPQQLWMLAQDQLNTKPVSIPAQWGQSMSLY